MNQDQIRTLIEERVDRDGLSETGIEGVQLFRATTSVPCVPVVYQPSVVVIASGEKEAVFDGRRYTYDRRSYLVCPTTLPVQAGTPHASPENPLFGVLITLDPILMGALAIEIETSGAPRGPKLRSTDHSAIRLSRWDDGFADALLRLLQLGDDETEKAVLGPPRLRELYYRILNGEAGAYARQAFGVGNAISRSIAHVSSHLTQNFDIDDLANRAGMSRAVFHRKFKEATSFSPIQFVKTMRLNSAAMKIVEGINVSQAALDVGYVSPSQFSREFKRAYGHTPKQWSGMNHGL